MPRGISGFRAYSRVVTRILLCQDDLRAGHPRLESANSWQILLLLQMRSLVRSCIRGNIDVAWSRFFAPILEIADVLTFGKYLAASSMRTALMSVICLQMDRRDYCLSCVYRWIGIACCNSILVKCLVCGSLHTLELCFWVCWEATKIVWDIAFWADVLDYTSSTKYEFEMGYLNRWRQFT